MRKWTFYCLLFLWPTFVVGQSQSDLTFTPKGWSALELEDQKDWSKSEAWQNFESQYGNWQATFNPLTGLPHRATGKPVQVSGEGTTEETALAFIQQNLAMFNLPVNQLQLTNIRSTKDYHYIDYAQYYDGVRVLRSRLTIRMTPDNRVPMFGIDVFPDLKVSTTPTLSRAKAKTIAAKDISQSIKSNEVKGLRILPIARKDGYDYHLVYKMMVQTEGGGTPALYRTLVDAHQGDVLLRENQVRHAGPQRQQKKSNKATIFLRVEETVYKKNPLGPTVVRGAPYARVEEGGNNYNTDADGELTLSNNSSTTVTIYLRGLYAKVDDRSDGTASSPSYSATVYPSSDTISFDNGTNLPARSGYYHTNLIHDYMKPLLGGYTGLDFALDVNASITTSSCNAYYSPTDPSINFYAEDGSCYDFTNVADIVYHEYGHAINDYFYTDQTGTSMNNGALNEGYADVWALGLEPDGIMGQGSFKNGRIIRRYDRNPKVYPEDIRNEVHADGEIIAGAWWDVARNLDSVQQMMDIFGEHFNGAPDGPNGSEGQVFKDALTEALLADDTDGDLTNGTPNDDAIGCAFAKHGITLYDKDSLRHTPINFHPAGKKIRVKVKIHATTSYDWYFDDMQLYYRTGTKGSWQSVAMSKVASDTMQGVIPAQSLSGSIVQYYIATCGTPMMTFPNRVFPAAVNSNVPYTIAIGYSDVQLQTFSSGFADWTPGYNDAATTGNWEIGATQPTFYRDSIMVQVGNDHTITPNDSMCAVTSITASSTAGDEDVDDGATNLISDTFDLSSYDRPAVSFYRYYCNGEGANPGNDFWQVYITHEDTPWIPVEHTNIPHKEWRHVAFRVDEYIDYKNKDRVMLKFVASDSIKTGEYLDGGSLVEAGLDDFRILEGCGSTYITSDTISATDCDSSYTVPSGDETYSVSGTYQDTIPNRFSCDSLLTINLTVDSTADFTTDTMPDTTKLCADTYTAPSGKTFPATDTSYIDTLVNQAGCDSLLTINLSLDSSKTNTTDTLRDTVLQCDDVYVGPSGESFPAVDSTYMDTIPNQVGCDSILTINLTVDSTKGNTAATIKDTTKQCDTLYALPSGKEVDPSPGTYMDTIPNQAGCDSILTINLMTGYTTDTLDDTLAQCTKNYVLPSGQVVDSFPAVYMDTLTNQAGCDSILTVDIDVDSSKSDKSVTIDVTEYDGVYIVPSGDEVYSTSDTLITTVQDTLVTDYGCDSFMTINLTLYDTITAIAPISGGDNQIYIRPNPADEYINVYFKGHRSIDSRIEIYDVTGRTVFDQRAQLGRQMAAKVDVSGVEQGVYFVRVTNQEGRSVRKVLIY